MDVKKPKQDETQYFSQDEDQARKAAKDEKRFVKLNGLLCTSFNNVKYDIRDINTRIENLTVSVSNIEAELVKKGFEKQNNLIMSQQKIIDRLAKKLELLEKKQEAARLINEVAAERVQKRLEEAKKEVLTASISHEKVAKKIVPKKTVKKTTNKNSQKKILRKLTKPAKNKSIYDVAKGKVKITKVQFKADKDGHKNLNGEWIELCGNQAKMTGCKIYDKGHKHVFRFPEGYVLNGRVKVFTGSGKNTKTKLYWDQPRPVWNDSGDVATLAKKTGKIISQVASAPEYSFKVMK